MEISDNHNYQSFHYHDLSPSECPANQIFLSLLNTLRGVILTLSFQVSNQDTEGRNTWGIQEVGHAGQLWAMGAVESWSVIWLQHFPLGDLGQKAWSLSAFTCPSVKWG